MSATYTASIYTWKAVANTMVYTGYAVAALAYELFWRREGLGPAVAGAGAADCPLRVSVRAGPLYRRAAGAYSASDPPHSSPSSPATGR